jgi:hypothetical protein
LTLRCGEGASACEDLLKAKGCRARCSFDVLGDFQEVRAALIAGCDPQNAYKGGTRVMLRELVRLLAELPNRGNRRADGRRVVRRARFAIVPYEWRRPG